MPQRKRSLFYKKVQGIANQMLSRAILSRRIPKASRAGRRCSDCGAGKPLCYDHRDYSEPLKVDVVCYPCNERRGTGLIPFVDVETLNVSVVYREAA